ncbi:TetR/AcrR family transcriptional regulator [Megasphaera paucivorans]|uniref:Transcriptional regulator, TetR family n=1 Tax=Megasphaera paucivorans TaxID=349095 RepID=A0A1G9SKX4_9FIRM|nr:TetR/AcrR family transcriptional regulator [Megasphaera paucivorans]SDM35920.1 transcriptional regulator, TetR family [Megasphaera paucivorans]
MTRIRKNPLERRQELIDIAMECFCTKGYEATMVQDICNKADVAKGTFFYYFPTKDDVLKAIFEHWTQVFIDSYSRQVKTADAVQKLQLFLKIFGIETPIDHLMNKLSEENRYDILLRFWTQCMSVSFNQLLNDVITQGMAEGSMQVAHTEECLDFFWGIMDAMWPEGKQNIITEKSITIREQIAGQLIEMLFGMKAGSLVHFEDAK